MVIGISSSTIGESGRQYWRRLGRHGWKSYWNTLGGIRENAVAEDTGNIKEENMGKLVGGLFGNTLGDAWRIHLERP